MTDPRPPEAPSAEDEAPPEDGARGRKRPLVQRFAPLLLVAGALGAAAVSMPRMPHEHEVELRLDDAATVVGIDYAWVAGAEAGHQDRGEPVQGGRLHCAVGSAPSAVMTKVRLPDGTYDLEVTVDRVAASRSTRRVIALQDAERISIPLR
jgi:hypothetical protein